MTMNSPNGFPGLKDYIRTLEVGHTSAFSRAERNASFETSIAEQRQFVLDRYEGVDAQHSYSDEGGQIFDCVPIDQQPALRRTGSVLASPPQRSFASGTVRPQLSADDAADRFGNRRKCPPGTVPLRRVTLEEINRFQSIERFLKKAPLNASTMRSQLLSSVAPTHEYAHAYQYVPSSGGRSVLNIWKPPVVSPSIFSLSQQWYVATGKDGLQTVEVGWQVFPTKYGHTNPVLFTYWTADGYTNTGSYSTDHNDFVIYSSSCPVGLSLGNGSTRDGQQIEIELAFVLHEGNWWLFVNGDAPENAVGYYPGALFAGGPMATGATEVDFGGETVGERSFPPMGSGAFAAEGNRKAAYHRNVVYLPSEGSPMDPLLTPLQDWPASYSIAAGGPPEWGVSFFFGGPGDASGN